MKRLDAIYKCRLCGKEYVECSTSGEKSNQRFVMDMMYRAVSQKKPEEVMEPAVEAMVWLIFWDSRSKTRGQRNEYIRCAGN